MKCPICGTEMYGTSYCPNCGYSLEKEIDSGGKDIFDIDDQGESQTKENED